MARFPHLRTVTLETIDQDEGELLVGESFPALFGSGQLRLRTCEEAWQAARDERYDPGALDEPGIVSPLWYTYANEPGDHFTSVPERQAQWYVFMWLRLPARIALNFASVRLPYRPSPVFTEADELEDINNVSPRPSPDRKSVV